MLLCELLLGGAAAAQLAEPVGFVGQAQPSQLLDGDGKEYWGMESRIAQLAGIRQYLGAAEPSPTADALLEGASSIAEERIIRASQRIL